MDVDEVAEAEDVNGTPTKPSSKKNKKKKSTEMDVDEIPAEPSAKKSKKKKSVEMDVDEAPTEPSTKKSKKTKSKTESVGNGEEKQAAVTNGDGTGKKKKSRKSGQDS